MLECVACGVSVYGDVGVGEEWEWSGNECSFFDVFNINILFTFVFAWCVTWVVIGGVRVVSVSV